jgi:hypothetical protein
MDGHYFLGGYYSVDGWSSAESIEIDAAVKNLEHDNIELTIANLRRAGVSDQALNQCFIAEFPPDQGGFSLLTPDLKVWSKQ